MNVIKVKKIRKYKILRKFKHHFRTEIRDTLRSRFARFINYSNQRSRNASFDAATPGIKHVDNVDGVEVGFKEVNANGELEESLC